MKQLIVILALLIPLLLSAAEWELRKEEEGIVIHTREAPGSNFAEYRGVVELECTLVDVLRILSDVETFADWMPDTENVELLSRTGCEQVYALETPAPWPVSRRDGVYKYRFERDTQLDVMRVAIRALPEELPERKGCVRVSSAEGFWLLKSLPDGKLAVSYQLLVDPGGSLPGWLANTKAVSRPFEMLHHLRERVAQLSAESEAQLEPCDADLDAWLTTLQAEELQ